MSVNIPALFVQQFSSNIQLLLQQKGSVLRESVMTGNHYGKQASPVDQIAKIEANKVTQRFGPIGRTDAAVDRRWVAPVDYDLNQLIDSFDKLKLIIDPESSYVQNAMYAMGRAFDNEILKSIFGANQTGEDGTTSTSFLAGNIIDVDFGSAAASGLSVAKLRRARKILMGHNLDLRNEQLYAYITADQHDDLLAETQIISSEFNGGVKPVLQDGMIMRFLGINFIHTELVPNGVDSAAGTSDFIPVFAKSGMYAGIWKDMENDVSQRKDLSGLPFQAYAKGSFGATRLEEKKIVKVQCRKAP
jgi:hypothetical protein